MNTVSCICMIVIFVCLSINLVNDFVTCIDIYKERRDNAFDDEEEF